MRRINRERIAAGPSTLRKVIDEAMRRIGSDR